MSNIRIARKNFVVGATLGANPALVGTMPETNLQNHLRGVVARTTGLSDQAITGDFADIANGGLVSNGDFEVDTTGWSVVGTASIARVASDARFGAACLEVTAGSANGIDRAQQAISNPLLKQGTNYTVAAWVKQTVGSGNAVHLRVSETGGATGGFPFVYAEATDPTTWTRIAASAAITEADRTGLAIHAGYNNAGQASGDKLLVDGVQLFVGDSVPAFDTPINCLYLAGHNLTDAATLRLQLYGDAKATQSIELYDSGVFAAVPPRLYRDDRRRCSIHWCDTTYDARSFKLTISDAGNPDGYLQAEHLFLGEYWSPSKNFAYDPTWTLHDGSSLVRSVGAPALRQEAGEIGRELAFNFVRLSDDEQEEWTRALTGREPVLVSLFPADADPNKEHRYTLLGHWRPSHQLSIGAALASVRGVGIVEV